MKFFITILFLCIISGCDLKTNNDNEFEISIKYGHSYVIDLKKHQFTAFFMEKSPTIVMFILSPDEYLSILTKFQKLGLNKINGDYDLVSYCDEVPQIFTKIIVKEKKKIQVITIQEDCRILSSLGLIIEKRIATFLHYVRSMIMTKEEIKSIPPSDIPYE